MDNHDTLGVMERVCDHMLEAFFIPPIKPAEGQKNGTVALFKRILVSTDKKFSQSFPMKKELVDYIPDNYYQTIQNTLAFATLQAGQLATYIFANELIMIKTFYNTEQKAYIVCDLLIRPCIWETGIVRQLTDALVRGLQTQGDAMPLLQFELKYGPSFLVSLTMEEMTDLFTNNTLEADIDKRKKIQTYVLAYSKFSAWTAAWAATVPEREKFTKKWEIDLLKSTDNEERFGKIRDKFTGFSPTKQAAIVAGIDAWDFLNSWA
jgi:hypothetical protein